MRRRAFIAGLGSTAAWPLAVRAQQGPRVAPIGWLTAQQAASLAPYLDALRAGFTELGYVEGRNVAIVFRYGDDSLERVPALAAELVKIPVDLIMAQGAAVPVIAKLGLAVPVVYVFSGDPVSAGLADSLARPRGNMTGLTFMAADLNGKRLELLREIMPELRRVAIIANPEHPGEQLERGYSEVTAQRLGISIDYFPTSTHDDLTRAFAKMVGDLPQAISLFADGFAVENRQSIIDFAMAHRLPVVSGWPVFAKSGALCTYGPRLTQSYRRLAYYVDRILKGARPADLPIEQPTQFELVVNQRTANTLGVTIPPSLLVRADDVIE
jgi:putative ABC transport system substrate-binding protein